MSEWYDEPCMTPDGAIWHPEGWESAVYESVQLREGVTRGQAAATFAHEIGEMFTWVRAWARSIRVLTIQEQWEYAAEASGNTDEDGNPTDPDGNRLAEHPPEGWYGEEDVPAWEFVARSHPAAVAVWVCADVSAATSFGAPPRGSA